MKKISLLLFSLLLLITSLTTVYAEGAIMLDVNGDNSFHIEDTGGNTLTQYIPQTDNLTFTLNGNNLIINSGQAGEVELVACDDGTLTFKQWTYTKVASSVTTEYIISNGETVSKDNLKTITAVYNPPPQAVTFSPNVNTVTYTSNPTDLSSVNHGETVTMTISCGANMQLNFIDFEGIGEDSVTKNGPTISFTVPSDRDVTVIANGGIIISNVNISLQLPVEGDTDINTPVINGTGYSFDGGTIIDLGSGDLVETGNPVVAGKQYGVAIGLEANEGYAFKYTGDLVYDDSDENEDDSYKYDVTTKLNGETISKLGAGEMQTGYLGGQSSSRRNFSIIYLFTATEAAPEPNPPSPSGGGSTPAYDHPVLNTGVK